MPTAWASDGGPEASGRHVQYCLSKRGIPTRSLVNHGIAIMVKPNQPVDEYEKIARRAK